MKTCTECGNRLVGGGPLLDHTNPPNALTYEYHCGHCGHWWLEDEPLEPRQPVRRKKADSERGKMELQTRVSELEDQLRQAEASKAAMREVLQELIPRYEEMFTACNLGNPADSVILPAARAALSDTGAEIAAVVKQSERLRAATEHIPPTTYMDEQIASVWLDFVRAVAALLTKQPGVWGRK